MPSSRYLISFLAGLIATVCLLSISLFFRSVFGAGSNERGSLDLPAPDPEHLRLKHANSSMHRIYIDVGCFNGETIEHFIHFIPDSHTYDIITFEPEPSNYQLCRNTLRQKKYERYSITILPVAAWIRNEQVFYQINQGAQSRINGSSIEANKAEVKPLPAVDFSSWLVQLWKPNRTRIHLKMSLPGAEVPVLEKMVLDGTVDFIHELEVEWADRTNPNIRATRIYTQLMFDSRGFDTLYYTRLSDARRAYELRGSLNDVQKYYDWKSIPESDTFAHYRQRPEEGEMLRRTFRRKVKF